MSLVPCPLTLVVVLDRVALRPPVRPPLSTRARRIARTTGMSPSLYRSFEKGQRESIEVAIFPENGRCYTGVCTHFLLSKFPTLSILKRYFHGFNTHRWLNIKTELAIIFGKEEILRESIRFQTVASNSRIAR